MSAYCIVRSLAQIALAAVAYTDCAQATTFSYTEDLSTVLTSSGPQVPDQATGLVIYPVASLTNVFRSPFAGTSQFGTAQYTSIEGGASATYNFAASDTLSIFWGSPDSWNTLSFFSGVNGTGTELFSITGASLLVNSVGHDLVTFISSGALFSSVVLTSAINAFEFSNLTASNNPPAPTPLPPAYSLFLAGLGALAVVMWHRRRRQAAAGRLGGAS